MSIYSKNRTSLVCNPNLLDNKIIKEYSNTSDLYKIINEINNIDHEIFDTVNKSNMKMILNENENKELANNDRLEMYKREWITVKQLGQRLLDKMSSICNSVSTRLSNYQNKNIVDILDRNMDRYEFHMDNAMAHRFIINYDKALLSPNMYKEFVPKFINTKKGFCELLRDIKDIAKNHASEIIVNRKNLDSVLEILNYSSRFIKDGDYKSIPIQGNPFEYGYSPMILLKDIKDSMYTNGKYGINNIAEEAYISFNDVFNIIDTDILGVDTDSTNKTLEDVDLQVSTSAIIILEYAFICLAYSINALIKIQVRYMIQNIKLFLYVANMKITKNSSNKSYIGNEMATIEYSLISEELLSILN